jgi:hypothetical protein
MVAGEESAKAALRKLLLDHPRSENRWIGIESERFVRNGFGAILHYEPEMHHVLCKLVERFSWKVDYQVDGALLGVKRR